MTIKNIRFSIFFSNSIENKKEMALHMIDILNSYLPNWQENIYYQNHFQNSEYNDYLFYLLASNILKILRINIYTEPTKDYQTLLDEYNEKLVLKK